MVTYGEMAFGGGVDLISGLSLGAMNYGLNRHSSKEQFQRNTEASLASMLFQQKLNKEMYDYTSAKNYDYWKQTVDVQDANQRKLMADTPSIQKQALKDAGYNPILAINSSSAMPHGAAGSNISGSSGSVTPSAPQSQRAEAKLSANLDIYRRIKEMELLDTQIDRAKSEAASAKAKSEYDKASFKLDERIKDIEYQSLKDSPSAIKIDVGGASDGKTFDPETLSENERAIFDLYAETLRRKGWTDSSARQYLKDTIELGDGVMNLIPGKNQIIKHFLKKQKRK